MIIRPGLLAAAVLALPAVALAAPAQEAFTVTPRGIFQLDMAHYDQDPAAPLATDFRRGSFGNPGEDARDLVDRGNFRRARLGVEGKAFGVLQYNLIYDHGAAGGDRRTTKIISAWVQYAVPGPLNLRARVGAFSAPTGLEEATSNTASLFAERASSAELVRGLASGDGRRAAALFAHGERWNLSGAVTGDVVGSEAAEEQRAFVGRAAWAPVLEDGRVLHLGVNLTRIVNPPGDGTGATRLRLRDRPEMRVDGTRLVDTGRIDAEGLTAIGGELGVQRGRLTVQAEYFDIRLDRKGALPDPDFAGWYAQAAWSLTGETRRYGMANAGFDGPRPARPFNPAAKAWGAWEVGLRYSHLDLDDRDIRGGRQDIWTLGLNWRPNTAVRFQAAVQDVRVDRRSPGGTAFGAATPPAGAQVGQDLRIYSLRAQYAF